MLNISDGVKDPVPQNSKNCGTAELKDVCIGNTKDQLSLFTAYLPTSWLRVFHPRPNLHALIANLIIYLMTERRAKYLNVAGAPETWAPTACPAAATKAPGDECARDEDCQQKCVFGRALCEGDPGQKYVYTSPLSLKLC